MRTPLRKSYNTGRPPPTVVPGAARDAGAIVNNGVLAVNSIIYIVGLVVVVVAVLSFFGLR